MNRSIQDVNNRWANLLGITLLCVTALTLVSVLFIEDEWADRADDLAVIALAVAGVVWYHWGQNRFKLSWTPLLLNTAALLTHVVAFIVEKDDPKSIGDNFLTIQYYLFTTVFIAWQFYQARRVAGLLEPVANARTTDKNPDRIDPPVEAPAAPIKGEPRK